MGFWIAAGHQRPKLIRSLEPSAPPPSSRGWGKGLKQELMIKLTYVLEKRPYSSLHRGVCRASCLVTASPCRSVAQPDSLGTELLSPGPSQTLPVYLIWPFTCTLCEVLYNKLPNVSKVFS